MGVKPNGTAEYADETAGCKIQLPLYSCEQIRRAKMVKQKPRTKGNVAPSKSSQAAKLLTSPGKFHTFSVFEDPGTAAESSTLVGVISLNEDIRSSFRKIGKKNDETRIKGIQEVMDFLQANPGDLKPMWKVWQRMYSKLFMDNCPLVRKLSHELTASFLHRQNCSQDPGSYLTAAPYAILGACDSNSSVCSCACLVTNEFFPGNPNELMARCCGSVLEVCCSILKEFSSSIAPLPNTTSKTPVQPGVGVHLALCTLVKLLSSSQHLEAVEKDQLKQLFDVEAFWSQPNYLDDDCVDWLKLTSIVQSVFPDLLVDKMNLITSILLKTSDSQNISIFEESWDFIMKLAETDAKFWQLVNATTELIPKVVSLLLESGPIRRGVSIAAHIPHLLVSLIRHKAEDKWPILLAFVDALLQSISTRIDVRMYAFEAVTCFVSLCDCLKIAKNGEPFIAIDCWPEKFCETVKASILSSNLTSALCDKIWNATIDLLQYFAKGASESGDGETEFYTLKANFDKLSEDLLECASVESSKLQHLLRKLTFEEHEPALVQEASRVYHLCLENGRFLLICEVLLSNRIDEIICRLEPCDSYQQVAFEFCEMLVMYISSQLKSCSPEGRLSVVWAVLFDALSHMESRKERGLILGDLFASEDYMLYKSAAIANEEYPFNLPLMGLPIEQVSEKCIHAIFGQSKEEILSSCGLIAHLLGVWWKSSCCKDAMMNSAYLFGLDLNYSDGFKSLINADMCLENAFLAICLFSRHFFECKECYQVVKQPDELLSILYSVTCGANVQPAANVEKELEDTLIAGLKRVDFSCAVEQIPALFQKLFKMCKPDISKSLSRERVNILWTSIRPLFSRFAEEDNNVYIAGILSLCRSLMPTDDEWANLIATRVSDWKVIGRPCDVIPLFYDEDCQLAERSSAEQKSAQCFELLNWSNFIIKLVAEALLTAQSISSTRPEILPLLSLFSNCSSKSFCCALAFIEYVRQLRDVHYVIVFPKDLSNCLKDVCQAADQIYELSKCVSPMQWLQCFIGDVKSGVTCVELFGIRFWSSKIAGRQFMVGNNELIPSDELVDKVVSMVESESSEKTKLQIYWALSPLGIRRNNIASLNGEAYSSLELSLVKETVFFEESVSVDFLKQLIGKKEDFEKTFFEEKAHDLSLQLSGIHFFERFLPYVFNLPSDMLDYIFCFSVMQMQAVEAWEKEEKLLFHLFSLRLCNQLSSFLLQPLGGIPPVDVEKYESIKSEWMEFLVPKCFKNELTSFYELASSENLSTVELLILRELSISVGFMNIEDILSSQLPELRSAALDDRGYPSNVQSLVLRFFPLLCKHQAFVQFAAYRVLERCVQAIRQYEPASSADENGGQNELRIPSFFCDAFSWFIKSFETSLFIVKDAVSLHPELNSTELFGYLLTWKLLLTYISVNEGRPETNPEFLHRQQQFSDVVRIVFFLLFEWFEVETDTNKQRLFVESPEFATAAKSSGLLYNSIYLQKFFKETSSFNIDSSIDQTTIVTLAFNVLFRLFELYPISIKSWWNDQNYKTNSRQYKFITQYISPVIIEKELKTLAEGTENYPNLKVSIYGGIREIIAAYVKEELRLELVIKIPEGYPLAVLSAEMTKQVVGFKKDGWTTLMRNLLCLLRTRTNGLVNCVLFWKINVESFLEGVEPCCICMMIVNNLNNFGNEIPRKTCRQCKHKFHSVCLSKWFRSAVTTTCPMCRTNFYLN
ncbi:hypothetical protein M513_01692 [Trichuris suis]|uniref:E3 ubiquitin-protein ligase listerin n=1 Tax=Trichuris suis TaxID=68888 RepID=A0A085MK43_9BILA|nr:hypothetical protein M513_01692 [Trichuris suis]